MYSQAPDNRLTPEQSYTVGNLIRKQLDSVGLGEVADYLESLKGSAVINADEGPAITTNRRRARPFTQMEPVVAKEDNAADLLSLMRVLDAETIKQNQKNSELYEQMLDGYDLR